MQAAVALVFSDAEKTNLSESSYAKVCKAIWEPSVRRSVPWPVLLF